LFEAAKHGCEDCVDLLLKAGADVNWKAKDNSTALVAASANGHAGIATTLIENGASLKTKAKGKKTLLHLAIESGNAELVRLILDNGGTANREGKIGLAVIAAAIQVGSTEILRLLLDRGVVVEPRRTAFSTHVGYSMHEACRTGNLPVVRLLSDRGFPFDAKSLVVASESGQTKIVRFLLDLHRRSDGTPNYVIGHNFREAVFAAAKTNHIEILRLLLDDWSCLNSVVRSRRGTTLFMEVCAFAPRGAVDFMLTHYSISINKMDNSEDTALDYAISHRNSDVVQALRDAGAQRGKSIISSAQP
jgi:ankyrin repeat protein